MTADDIENLIDALRCSLTDLLTNGPNEDDISHAMDDLGALGECLEELISQQNTLQP